MGAGGRGSGVGGLVGDRLEGRQVHWAFQRLKGRTFVSYVHMKNIGLRL